MVPIPPGEGKKFFADGFREAPFDVLCRDAGNYGVRRDIFGDDGSCCDDGSVANADARQDDGTMADPDIVADDHALLLAQFTETLVDFAIHKIFIGTIGDVVLGDAVHRVAEGVDADIGRDRCELSNGCVNRFRAPGKITVVAKLTFGEDDANANDGEAPQNAVAHFGCGMNAGAAITAGFGRMAGWLFHHIAITKKPSLAERLFEINSEKSSGLGNNGLLGNGALQLQRLGGEFIVLGFQQKLIKAAAVFNGFEGAG